MSSYGGDLVREARKRAALTQRELAERAGTVQPVVARWESGRTAISLDDVRRLVRLCGFDLEIMLVPADDSDAAQARRLADLEQVVVNLVRNALEATPNAKVAVRIETTGAGAGACLSTG